MFHCNHGERGHSYRCYYCSVHLVRVDAAPIRGDVRRHSEQGDARQEQEDAEDDVSPSERNWPGNARHYGRDTEERVESFGREKSLRLLFSEKPR